MNQATILDTHKNYKRLVGAGADEKLAEAIIECQSSSQLELATKADLRASIAELESRLTIKLYTALLAQAALIITLIKLLPF